MRIRTECSQYIDSENERTMWAKAHAGQEVKLIYKQNEALPAYKVLAEDGTTGFLWAREFDGHG